MNVSIRPERPGDAPVIRRIIERAFATAAHSDGTEHEIVRRLRAADALTVSLVAELDGQVRGHVAASPITVSGRASTWHGLGPVAVEPSVQGLGLGGSLVRECLSALKVAGSTGCVVLGDPLFYERFGFRRESGLTYAGAPAEYFMALVFSGAVSQGAVAYHPAFGDA